MATLQDAKAVRRFLRWERQQRKEAEAEAVANSKSPAESSEQVRLALLSVVLAF